MKKKADGKGVDTQDAATGVSPHVPNRGRRRKGQAVDHQKVPRTRSAIRRPNPQILLPHDPQDDAATVVRVPRGGRVTPTVVHPPVGLEAYRSTASPERARPLPVAELAGSIRQILRDISPDAAGILFDAINGLRDCAERARQSEDIDPDVSLRTEAACINMSGRLAKDIIELMIGKQVSMNVNISNQESVGLDWDELPTSAREEYESLLEKEMLNQVMQAAKS